jgi:hypothetical protein
MPADGYTVRLALTFTNWVNRNVERFEFVDAVTVRQQMSIDFELPGEANLRVGQVVAVPLMVPHKGLLRGLDVTDAKGHSLNVLESEETRNVVLGGLETMLASFAQLDRAELPSKTLRTLVGDEPGRAKELAERELAENGSIGKLLNKGNTKTAKLLKALVEELAEGFLLLVALPYQPGAPGIVKVSVDARLKELAREDNGKPKRGFDLLLKRVLSSLGLEARVERFEGLRVRHARSYHVEVIPPPGIYSGETTLTVILAPEDSGDREDPCANGVCRDTHPSRPHLWIGGGGHETDRGDRGRVEALLYPQGDGLVFPLFFSAAVIAGALALVPAKHTDLDGITLGALLLAPVALATYYARSDENGYLTMALRGVRLLATLSVVAGIVVIALLALGYIQPHQADGQAATSNPTAIEIARWAGVVAFVCADALALALIAPWAAALVRQKLDRRAEHSQEAGRKVAAREYRVLPLILIAIGVVAGYVWFAWLHL